MSGELAEPRLVTVTVPLLHLRAFAETTQEVTAELARGSVFPVAGWIIGERVADNPVWWLAGPDREARPRWRMWSGGTDLAGAAILALPRA